MIRVWLRSETTTFGADASDFCGATGGEGEADTAWGELDIAETLWVAADGCGVCGVGCVAAPITAWVDCIPLTRLHAVKDIATATRATTATLLPRSFMANVYRVSVRRLKERKDANFRPISRAETITCTSLRASHPRTEL